MREQIDRWTCDTGCGTVEEREHYSAPSPPPPDGWSRRTMRWEGEERELHLCQGCAAKVDAWGRRGAQDGLGRIRLHEPGVA